MGCPVSFAPSPPAGFDSEHRLSASVLHSAPQQAWALLSSLISAFPSEWGHTPTPSGPWPRIPTVSPPSTQQRFGDRLPGCQDSLGNTKHGRTELVKTSPQRRQKSQSAATQIPCRHLTQFYSVKPKHPLLLRLWRALETTEGLARLGTRLKYVRQVFPKNLCYRKIDPDVICLIWLLPDFQEKLAICNGNSSRATSDRAL